MKKRFKGFTLIECLIALAILGIASLTMAQIYASVARRNRSNHLVNTSLSNQMTYVERYTDSQAVSIYYGGGTTSTADSHASGDHQPPHAYNSSNSGTNSYIMITRIDSSKSGAASRDQDQVYSFPADLYILRSRDQDNNVSADEKDLDLRYKYLTSHSNS